MTEETIGVIIAALALGAFIWYARNRETSQQPIGTTQPIATTLEAAVNPETLSDGPTYFIANQPYYFAPPVGNIMPPATASRTTQTNIDGQSGCGCGW